MKLKSLAFAWIVFAGLVLQNASAQTPDIFISFSDFGDPTPASLNTVGTFDVGSSGSAYVWVRNGFDIDTGAFLDVFNDDTAVSNFTAVAVFNPAVLVVGNPFSYRWVDEDPGDQPGGAIVPGVVTPGSVLEFGAFTVTGGTGIVTGNSGPLFLDQLYDSNSNAFLFARIDFNVIGVGTSLFSVEAGDGNGAPIVNNGALVFPNFAGASLNAVNPIPEPATAGILLVCLAGLATRRRR